MTEVALPPPRPARHSRRAIFALAFLAAVGFGAWSYYQLAPALRDALASRKDAESPAPPPALAQPAQFPAPPTAKPPGVEESNAPEPLPLVLASALPGRNAGEGVAAIGTSADSALMYGTGALLPNGARLAEVHADHIVLESRGVRAKLYLGGRAPEALTTDARASTRAAVERKLLYVGGAKNRPSEHKPEPGYALASIVRTQPLFAGGELKGIQLAQGDDARLFAALGFKSGDLVLAIDGARIESAAQAEDLLGALDSGAPVAVTLEREGRLEHLNVDVAAARKAPPAPAESESSLPPPPASPPKSGAAAASSTGGA
jgi:type II secretion system protein C